MMVLVLVLHALVLPRLAMMPRAFVGRETEHELRLEVAWRGGAAQDEEVRLDSRSRRSVSHFAELAARRPTTSLNEARLRAARPRSGRTDLVNRNGSGGPLRC
jgi:hypothetical protein